MADKKTKVLIIAPSMRLIGGQSIQAKRLLDALSDNENVEMSFLPNDPPNAFQNIKILRTIFTSLKYWWLLLIKIPKIDIVQIFSSGTTSYIISTLPALFAAKLFGKKTILNYHTGEAEEHLKNWKLTAKPTMKWFDKIVVPSDFLVNVFDKYDLVAEAVANFIETEKYIFRERNPLKPVFLANRNFEKHYQVGDVLRAFQIIQKTFSEAEIMVAGSGSEENSLKKLAENLDLKNIQFVGKIEQIAMPKLYDAADIYLNSSIVDNMPLSIIEAFTCGLPVVSTNPGGISFMIKNGETGLLVETNDYEALAREAMKLLENNALAQSIISNAQSETHKYNWENVKDKWLECYRKIVF